MEKVIDDYNLNYPVCVDVKGKTPLEDVGGDPGYEKFFKILKNKNNLQYENMLNWAAVQEYEDCDIKTLNDFFQPIDFVKVPMAVILQWVIIFFVRFIEKLKPVGKVLVKSFIYLTLGHIIKIKNGYLTQIEP